MSEIDLDTPLPLKEAVAQFFPAGGVTEQSLRTEIRKGRLVPERIAGKCLVTGRAINEMRNRAPRRFPASDTEQALPRPERPH